MLSPKKPASKTELTKKMNASTQKNVKNVFEGRSSMNTSPISFEAKLFNHVQIDYGKMP
jgi:hypothetical protein